MGVAKADRVLLPGGGQSSNRLVPVGSEKTSRFGQTVSVRGGTNPKNPSLRSCGVLENEVVAYETEACTLFPILGRSRNPQKVCSPSSDLRAA